MQHVYGSHLHASKPNLHVCSFTDSLRPHYQTKIQALPLPCSDDTCRYVHVLWEKKKRRTRAIYKVINNLFFLYINLYKDNITYVCDSNFLYRILLIFNMALKGTVAYSYTISLINLQFLSYVSEHTALSNLRPFINF